jgi:transcription elongation factor GreA
MSVADLYLTKEGVDKLNEELQRLKTVDRKEVIAKIKEARLYGDLSENAEYHTARERQAVIEGRIEEIEALLKKAKIIKHEIKHETVELGSKVTVSAIEIDGDKKDAYEEVFTIVGSTESDPLNGLISAESPLGAALVGAKKGETIKVPVPNDDFMTYKIKSID